MLASTQTHNYKHARAYVTPTKGKKLHQKIVIIIKYFLHKLGLQRSICIQNRAHRANKIIENSQASKHMASHPAQA